MSKIKELNEIAWNVDEPTYRADSALSYSTIARYEREGFNNIDKLYDKIDTPSLTFGSCVDSIITDGIEDFNNRFMVAEFPIIPDSIITIVKDLFTTYSDKYYKIEDIPNEDIIKSASVFNYQNNWKPETRAKVIREKGSTYYSLLYLSKDKTIIDTNTYEDVQNSVFALKNSEATKYYFADNNPFEDVCRYYQLKFKATLNGIDYRCMFDLIIVDYKNKTIRPIDLKTSSHKEWDFYLSFVQWNYNIQNRLYVRILQDNISKDDYFKDFKILPYKDIVVNRKTLTPLVWDCDFTFTVGLLKFGKNNQIEMRDPEVIAKELKYYLDNINVNKVPIGININKSNDLRTWLNIM